MFYTVFVSQSGGGLGTFRFADAREILAPHLAEAHRREAVRRSADRREAERTSGVAWSGMGAPAPAPPRNPASLKSEAAAALASARAFALGPRGRLLDCLERLEQAGCSGAVERARAAFARGFADPDRLACPAEIGVALTALARLERPESRSACVALSELLAASLGCAAE